MQRLSGGSTRVLIGSVAGFALALAGLSPGAHARAPRVPGGYFGVNFQNVHHLQAHARAAQLRSMHRHRVKQVRFPVPWSMVEPDPPDRRGHHYRWRRINRSLAALARHHVRAQATIAHAPPWASSATPEQQLQCRQRGAEGLGAGAPRAYAALARAVARRYGSHGRFWTARPALPYKPIRLFEIWNAPNTAGTWCPQVDPEGYGIMFAKAARAIRGAQPHARVVVGGVGSGARTQNGSVATDEFLRRMTAAKPAVRRLASAVGVHVYPGKDPTRQLSTIPLLRSWIRAAGFPDRTPMLVNEIGFSRAGSLDFTEPERVIAYRSVMSRLPRTNCNVSGILAYTWSTRQQDLADAEQWFGIVDPSSGALYPSGREFVKWVRRFRGHGRRDAPRRTLMLCPGMPKPDQDGDGVLDEDDSYPLNPRR